MAFKVARSAYEGAASRIALALVPCALFACSAERSAPPAERPPRADTVPRLVDVTDQVGPLHETSSTNEVPGPGVVLFDYDNDGRTDIFFPDEPCRLYRNVASANGVGFELHDVSAESGLAAACSGIAGAALDYDRDGWTDLVVAGPGGVRLLRNVAGRFEERTRAAGIGGEVSAASVSVADFDRDGHPDIYVGQYVDGFSELVGECAPNRLYVNQGDGTFLAPPDALGAADRGCTLAATFVDLDGDGQLELLVGNDFGSFFAPSEAYRFDGERFHAVGRALGLDLRAYTMGFALGDVDGDGALDLYATNIGRNSLLRGGAAGFADATEAFGAGAPWVAAAAGGHWRWSWGAALSDFDLDGRLDLFVASGHVTSGDPVLTSHPHQPNLLFAGRPGALVPAPLDDHGGGSSRGVAIGDLDGDGVPDVVVARARLPGGQRAAARPAVLLGVRPAGARSLVLRLRATVSDLRATGARVVIRASGREQMRDVDSGGASTSSQHDGTLHFGLEDAERADSVRVRWPSGLQTEHGPLAADRVHLLEEPRWWRVPATMAAGSTANLEIDLPADAAVPVLRLGAGETVGELRALGAGRYRQALRAPLQAGTFTVDARWGPGPQRVRARIQVVGSERASIAVADLPLRTLESREVVVSPRRVDGTLLGPGAVVEVRASAGACTAAVDRGDGTYVATLRAPAAPQLVLLTALVDGRVNASTPVEVIPAFDPSRSSIVAVHSSGQRGTSILLRARISDRGGRPVPVTPGDVVLVASAGSLRAYEGSYHPPPGVALSWLELPHDAPAVVKVEARVFGEPLSRSATLHVPSHGHSSRALLDVTRSGVAAYHTAMPADGRSRVRVVARAWDQNGAKLRAASDTRFSATTGTLEGPLALVGEGASQCLRAPSDPGTAVVTATLGDVALGAPARIVFYRAEPGAPPQDGCGELSF